MSVCFDSYHQDVHSWHDPFLLQEYRYVPVLSIIGNTPSTVFDLACVTLALVILSNVTKPVLQLGV